MTACALCTSEAVDGQMLCAPCFQHKWGPEPVFSQALLPCILQLVFEFVHDDLALWLENRLHDLETFRALLQLICTDHQKREFLLQYRIFFTSIKHKEQVPYYLVDHFVASEDNCKLPISNDIFYDLLSENHLPLLQQLPRNAFRAENVTQYVDHNRFHPKADVLHWMIVNFDLYRVHFVSNEHALDLLCVLRLTKTIQELIGENLFRDARTCAKMLECITSHSMPLHLFKQVWDQAFKHEYIPSFHEKILARVWATPKLARKNRNVLTHFVRLKSFRVPISQLNTVANCCLDMDFSNWLVESNVQWRFLLRSDNMWTAVNNEHVRRVLFHHLDQFPNNRKRLDFLCSQKIHGKWDTANQFLRLARNGDWDMILELISRYSLKSLGPQKDVHRMIECANGEQLNLSLTSKLPMEIIGPFYIDFLVQACNTIRIDLVHTICSLFQRANVENETQQTLVLNAAHMSHDNAIIKAAHAICTNKRLQCDAFYEIAFQRILARDTDMLIQHDMTFECLRMQQPPFFAWYYSVRKNTVGLSWLADILDANNAFATNEDLYANNNELYHSLETAEDMQWFKQFERDHPTPHNKQKIKKKNK